MDLPRPRLVASAKEALKDNGNCCVYFKYTCRHCKERVTFTRPNILYAQGDCFKCGRRSKVEAGGYMLVFNTRPEDIPPTPVIEENPGAAPTCPRPVAAPDLFVALNKIIEEVYPSAVQKGKPPDDS
jgi:hypothetical protein